MFRTRDRLMALVTRKGLARVRGGVRALLVLFLTLVSTPLVSAQTTVYVPLAANSESLGDLATSSETQVHEADGPGPLNPTVYLPLAANSEFLDELATTAATSSSWQGLGGLLTSAPAVASWGNSRLDVFVRGTDNALHSKSYYGDWGGWYSLGGQLTSAPAAVSWGYGRIDVFARGRVKASGPDTLLIHRRFDGGAWSGWEDLGGVLGSAPAVASWASGRLDVFARGTKKELIHKWFDGGAWSGWEPLGPIGGELTSAPAAVSWSNGRIDVFARGKLSASSPGNELIHKWFDGTWSNWESLGPIGGEPTSAPAVASWGSGRLDVFARGRVKASDPDNLLIHKWFNGTWSNWESLNREITSSPGAVSWSNGRIDVFASGRANGSGPNNELIYQWSDRYLYANSSCPRAASPPVITLDPSLVPVGQKPGRQMIGYQLRNGDGVLIIVDDAPGLPRTSMLVEVDLDPVQGVKNSKMIEAWTFCHRSLVKFVTSGIKSGAVCAPLTAANDYRSGCTTPNPPMRIDKATTSELWLRKQGSLGNWDYAEVIDQSIWQVFGGRRVRFIWFRG